MDKNIIYGWINEKWIDKQPKKQNEWVVWWLAEWINKWIIRIRINWQVNDGINDKLVNEWMKKLIEHRNKWMRKRMSDCMMK